MRKKIRISVKALLLHVGTDTTNPKEGYGTLGIVGPIFQPQRTFEYIPLSDGVHDKCEDPSYSDVLCRNLKDKTLADLIPDNRAHDIVHNDPDFESGTYGEPFQRLTAKRRPRRTLALYELEPDDYLFFVAGLAPFVKEAYGEKRTRHSIYKHQKNRIAKYIIGVFPIDNIFLVTWKERKAYSVSDLKVDRDEPTPLNERDWARLQQNPHSRSDDAMIVLSKYHKGRLFKKALQITLDSSNVFRPNSTGKLLFGDKSFTRGFKWVTNEDSVNWLLEQTKHF
jgi:hypothetical protein